jgi:inhibitor of KinA sporulation pathway (predicted exonuclease)
MSYPILVVDLEATCSDDGSIAAEDMETIEVGACWVTADGSILDRFQSFVRPIKNPYLTPFCTQLTGILQRDIDSAPSFLNVAASLQRFVKRHRTPGAIWMSWGTYDDKQFTRDSMRHGVDHPIPLPHQNAKRMFAKSQRIGKEVGMAKACELAQLQLVGVHHRALDDALNVARLLPWVLGERVNNKFRNL